MVQAAATEDFSHNIGRDIGRGRAPRKNKIVIFKAAILVAMVAPLVAYGAQAAFGGSAPTQPVWAIVPLMVLLGDTHVFATGYLYTQSDSFRGVPYRFAVLFVVPGIITAFSIYAMAFLPSRYLLWLMVLYVHYALFHFARQNIGVLSFVTLSSMRRPIHRDEKRILNGVAICGMLGALKLYAPGLLLNPIRLPLDLSPVAGAIPVLYDLGFAAYAVVLLLAAYRFFTRRAAYDRYSAIIFWLCVVWYLPIYAALNYPLLSIAAFTTAHGFQYLIFLALHAYRRSHECVKRGRKARAASTRHLIATLALASVPFLLFFAAICVGGVLARRPTMIFVGIGDALNAAFGAGAVVKIGAGLVAGLTLSHFWVDQFIWRFRTPERRAWLFENFPFLLNNGAQARAR